MTGPQPVPVDPPEAINVPVDSNRLTFYQDLDNDGVALALVYIEQSEVDTMIQAAVDAALAGTTPVFDEGAVRMEERNRAATLITSAGDIDEADLITSILNG